MNDLLDDIAEEIGVQDPDHLTYFISRRAQGESRSNIAEKLSRSARTLYNWSERFEEIDKDRRTRAIIKAIIEEEQLDLEVGT